MVSNENRRPLVFASSSGIKQVPVEPTISPVNKGYHRTDTWRSGYGRGQNAGMSLPPYQAKFTSGERRNRQTDKLTMIRLHVAIGRALDDLGSTTPKGHW